MCSVFCFSASWAMDKPLIDTDHSRHGTPHKSCSLDAVTWLISHNQFIWLLLYLLTCLLNLANFVFAFTVSVKCSLFELAHMTFCTDSNQILTSYSKHARLPILIWPLTLISHTKSIRTLHGERWGVLVQSSLQYLGQRQPWVRHQRHLNKNKSQHVQYSR